MLLPFTQAKQVLDRLKRLCIGRDLPDAGRVRRFDKPTKDGKDMRHAQELLATAVASIVGKREERAVASLFYARRHPCPEGRVPRHRRLRGGGVPRGVAGGRSRHGDAGMTVDDLIQALGLPESTRLNQRVPKKLLAEHGAATAADKRQIQDGVDEIVWLAALKPHLIGVPPLRTASASTWNWPCSASR